MVRNASPPTDNANKLLGKKDKKNNQAALSDMGVASLETDAQKHEDSFERHYNKDLDLDEGNSLLA